MYKKSKTIQQQFVQHCAIIIQSRWKGYLQRKRYRKFLPIYRRVKQLLLSVYLGWKVRRIFKLRSIKTQIIDIRDGTKKKHLSQVRIAKRQLIDQIARLSKKGQWIDEFKKFRNIHQKNIEDSKQNSSLYANVKSKSIKNIFKPIVQSHNNIEFNKKLNNQNKSTKNIEYNNNLDNFDDVPIRIAQAYYCQQKQLQSPPQKQFQKTKPILRISRKGRQNTLDQQSLNKSSQNSINSANNRKNQLKSLKTYSSISAIKQQQADNQELLQQSINLLSKHKKKIQITISKSSTYCRQETRQKKNCSIQCSLKLSQIQKNVKTQISTLINSKMSNQSNQRDIYSLIQKYESTYTKKKQQVKQKLAFLDARYTQSMKQNYKRILSKLRPHLI